MSAPLPPLFELRGLTKSFPAARAAFGRAGTGVPAVADVDLALSGGETLGLIGESGCGKTTLARCALKLYPPSAGRILYRGADVTRARGPALRRFRRAVQMIFQDPYGSLDPRMSVGAIIEEPLRIHRAGDRRARRQRVAAAMAAVGLGPELANRFPHEFSGGQRQRIGIARALVLDPELLIADEPVSSLDVSIRSQVLNLLAELQAGRGIGYLFITHDLAVVDFIADRVAVMYFGRIVEIADHDRLFSDPRHPYTQALREAVPRPGTGKRRRGTALRGEPPNPMSPPPGCPFHPRCPKARALCREALPALEPVDGERRHLAACHFK